MKFKPIIEILRVRNIPVLLHWSALLAFPIAWAATRSLLGGCVGLIAYLLLVLTHEVGHAVVASYCGLQVLSLRLYAIHGLCIHEAARSRWAEVAIAWGGVAAQCVLLLAAILAAKLLVFLNVDLPHAAEAVFVLWIPFNLFTIFTNLIPFPPLDGARAWRVVPMVATALLVRLKKRKSRPTPANVASIELARIANQRKKAK